MQLLNFLVQVLLALGEFLEAVQDLELLALLGVLLGRSLVLRLVTIFLLFELQLVELCLLRLAAGRLAFALALAARHVEFVQRELEQGLIRGLLGGK